MFTPRHNSIIENSFSIVLPYITQGLCRCLGRENLIVAEASLFTGAFLVTGLDISVHVQAFLDGFSAGFHFPVLKV